MTWLNRIVVLSSSALVVACTLAACSAGGAASNAFSSDDEDSGGGVAIDSGSSSATTDSGGTTTTASDAGGDAAKGPTGNPVGFPCTKPTDCTSGLCENVLPGGSSSVCVSTCTSQADCTDNFFCDPLTSGASSGYCVPHSPSHCEFCTTNSDCGSLSEVCGTMAGDTVKACHIDCSLASGTGTTSACPSDYQCLARNVDGVSRNICVPKGPITSCVDALGGFCDRVSTPQSCARSNSAGQCVGYRNCLAASDRYDVCGAAAPTCLACGASPTAGCSESTCSNAALDVNNCGTCGNKCPGLGAASDNVTCNTSGTATCTFSCQGEHYDVNNYEPDGCEVADSPLGDHTSSAAGATNNDSPGSCADDSSSQNFGGIVVSDARVHENASIDGFISAGGYAPDWYRVHGGGGATCYNDIGLTLQVSGSSSPTCYALHVQTDRYANTDCTTNASGNCTAGRGGGSLPCGVWPLPDCDPAYSNNTDILIEVYKTCNSLHEAVSYNVSGHF